MNISLKARRNLLLALFVLLFVFLPIHQLSKVNLISLLIAVLLFFKPVRNFFWGQSTTTANNQTASSTTINSFGIHWPIWLILGILSSVYIYFNIGLIDTIDPDQRLIRLALISLALGCVGFFTAADKIKLW